MGGGCYALLVATVCARLSSLIVHFPMCVFRSGGGVMGGGVVGWGMVWSTVVPWAGTFVFSEQFCVFVVGEENGRRLANSTDCSSPFFVDTRSNLLKYSTRLMYLPRLDCVFCAGVGAAHLLHQDLGRCLVKIAKGKLQYSTKEGYSVFAACRREIETR